MTTFQIDDVPHSHNTYDIPDTDYAGDWWNHPDRPCKGREEYSDLTLVPPRHRAQRIREMIASCYSCPVLRECREDMLATMSTYEMYGVRAGYRGKT